ncbi:lipocalin family protein [Chryseobacterium sp. PS-8]|uniref:Lipocalin family protein n=1 Tax=Chryseobacterium indicum TaxID=2766954 RepID=A0ABS9C4M3_9FLAO|nr:lipocalin family protein [Chryseobacterium sp. PS-8]MCF2219516.1 lipocalin family protein [Chryseobacterium sp. PS-8]
MKKILFLAISAGFLFTACKSDDDDVYASVVGVWKPSREMAVSGKNGSTIYNDPSSSCYKKSTFDFKSNNTMVSNIFDEGMSGNCENLGTDTSSYSYDPLNKQIVIDGESSEVLKLTNYEMHIVSDYSDEDGDGIDDKIVLVLIR